MKLYLSSYFFGANAHMLPQLVTGEKKVAIIMNAGDFYGDEMRPVYFKSEAEKFSALGFEAEELDLRQYFYNNNGLEDALKDYGLIWAMGGNTFILQRALKQSGADVLFQRLVSQNLIVYAGFSAGAVVATPTLHGIELIDNPNEIPKGYDPKIVWDGMGLVNYSIAPHYKSAHPESVSIDNAVTYFEQHNMPFITLSDGEDIVVDTPSS